MDTAIPQKFPFILDRNSAKANCTGNQVCTSCDIEVLGCYPSIFISFVGLLFHANSCMGKYLLIN